MITTVLIEGSSYNNITTILNNELINIDTWLQENKLTINTKKTHHITLHRARLKPAIMTMTMTNNLFHKTYKCNRIE